MPRGVYDRSHLKTKKAAAGAAPAPIVKSAPMAKAATKGSLKKAKAKGVTGGSLGATAYPAPAGVGGTAPHDLYQHLASLTQARGAIAATQVGHNETLLGAFDGELIATVKSLTLWREGRFPSSAPKEEIKAAPAPKAAAPVVQTTAPVAPPAPVPAPVVQGGGSPPLPFTPATAAEVMKSAGA